MKITLCGAAGEVTGSGYHVETDRARVLVDFGMFQGRGATEARQRNLKPVVPGRLDAVLLTHAHLDHSGRLPLLGRRGLKAPIWTTAASVDFAQLVLEDSGRIQEADARHLSRKRARAGKGAVAPLYTVDEVKRLEPLYRQVAYGEARPVAEGIRARYVDAGHILGSASIELTIEEAGRSRIVVFSGDVGPRGLPFLKDPTRLDRADLVFMESTYGDRDHKPLDGTLAEFAELLARAHAGRRKILIPAFAIGRTQQILYYIAEMVRAGSVPVFPIVLDSPMGIRATELYGQHRKLFDAEAHGLVSNHQFFRDLAGLRVTETADESRALNELDGPMVIIAGSGMCDGGRIVHHLRHNLWREDTDVVMVGYQGEGTLGHRLVSGADEVSIHGERVVVRAQVHTLGGFSAHAGQTELLDWLAPLLPGRPRLVLTHGEPEARAALADLLGVRHGLHAEQPEQFAEIVLD
jgi:metallo-beta-lactamase family protein